MVVLLAIAELLVRTGVVSPAVLPLASTVLDRAVGLLGNGRFLADLAATVAAWAVGLLIAVVVAVPAGLVLGSVPGVRTATRVIVELLRPIPSVALIPLVSLIIGVGPRMTITLIVYAAVWPVLFNTIYGLQSVEPVAKQTLRSFGFSQASVLMRVSLPSAAPFIATGIRLASSIAIIVAVAVGIVAGRINGPGIGAFIADANSGAGNTALVLAATLWAGVLGLILDTLAVTAERRMFHWHSAYSREAG
ncbi:ABC transporter permease subunit [Nocardia sp. CDC159]|uniref:ABC transporter permease subunit n=1 Tax=Nocardia pulmonis TaxID=2951408 RepID=A0A9X2E6U4_9NOCA|nr:MULTISPECIES: ABC transporter permease subunit [Nocardia]MCM6774726.1 ABC transporter permease subunit [Nocardia pulmonis]MCM6787209.1 ABC transporter permease subunit [Nocardia sp. CDC159]